jgi:hypothetical protein
MRKSRSDAHIPKGKEMVPEMIERVHKAFILGDLNPKSTMIDIMPISQLPYTRTTRVMEYLVMKNVLRRFTIGSTHHWKIIDQRPIDYEVACSEEKKYFSEKNKARRKGHSFNFEQQMNIFKYKIQRRTIKEREGIMNKKEEEKIKRAKYREEYEEGLKRKDITPNHIKTICDNFQNHIFNIKTTAKHIQKATGISRRVINDIMRVLSSKYKYVNIIKKSGRNPDADSSHHWDFVYYGAIDYNDVCNEFNEYDRKRRKFQTKYDRKDDIRKDFENKFIQKTDIQKTEVPKTDIIKVTITPNKFEIDGSAEATANFLRLNKMNEIFNK